MEKENTTELKSESKMKFVVKVALWHTFTYFVCGLIFSNLFNYEEIFKLGSAAYYMRDMSGTSSAIGPFVQIVRGFLYGFVLLLIRDTIEGSHGWLKLWAILIGIGIIGTPAASPVSIEGLIYSTIPLEFHLKTSPEVFTQTLLFSLLVTKKGGFKIPEKIKVPIFATIISAFGFSLSGIILAFILKVDMMASASDPFAFLVMFAALVVVFFISLWYVKNRTTIKAVIYYIVCYIALVGFPTTYNFLSGSPLASPLSLAVCAVSVVAVAVYMICTGKKEEYNSSC